MNQHIQPESKRNGRNRRTEREGMEGIEGIKGKEFKVCVSTNIQLPLLCVCFSWQVPFSPGQSARRANRGQALSEGGS